MALWLLLQAIAGLMPLLGMAPLLGEWALPLLDLVGVFSLFAVRRRR